MRAALLVGYMNFSDKGITYLLAAVAVGFAVGLFQGVLPMSAKARGWIAAVIIVAALTVLFVAPSSGEDFVAWFLIIGQGLIAWIVGLAIGAGARLIADRLALSAAVPQRSDNERQD